MSPSLVTQTPLAHFCWGGAGTTVLLLHGVGGGRQAWQISGTGAALAVAGFHVLAADFPGYGLSAPVQPYTLAGMAGAVINTVTALGCGRWCWWATAWAAWWRKR